MVDANVPAAEGSSFAVPADRLQWICYAEIGPHLEAYRATPDLEAALPFLEAHHYHRFAAEVARRAAGWVVGEAMEAQERLVPPALRGSPQITMIQPSVANGHVERHLAQHFDTFLASLGQFEQLLAGLKLQMQSVGERIDKRVEGAATLAGVIGAVVGLGPLGAAAGGAAAGYFMAKTVEKELEAAGTTLQESFQATLGLWDAACTRVMDDAVAMAAGFADELRQEVEAAEQTLRAARHNPPVPQRPARVQDASLFPPPESRSSWPWIALAALIFAGTVTVIIVFQGQPSPDAGGAMSGVQPVATTVAPTAPATPSPGTPDDRLQLVIVSGGVVYEGPAESFGVVRHLDSSTPAAMLDSSVPGWIKVRLDGGVDGWVAEQSVHQGTPVPLD